MKDFIKTFLVVFLIVIGISFGLQLLEATSLFVRGWFDV